MSRRLLLLLWICLSTRTAVADGQRPQGVRPFPPTPTDDIVRATEEATFVFSARVIARPAATTSAIYVSDFSTIVQIDSIYRVPEVVGRISGRRITVILQDTVDLEPQEEYLFFAVGLLADSSLVLQESARYHIRGSQTFADMRRVLVATDSVLEDEALSRRLSAADLVVTGRVDTSTIRQLRDTVPAYLRGEHALQWTGLSVNVTQVLHGRDALSGQLIRVVVFSRERSVRRPVLLPGDDVNAVFILRRLARIEAAARPPLAADTMSTYVASHWLDVQPGSEGERIRRLLRSIETARLRYRLREPQ